MKISKGDTVWDPKECEEGFVLEVEGDRVRVWWESDAVSWEDMDTVELLYGGKGGVAT